MDSTQEQRKGKRTWWLVFSLTLWTGALGSVLFSLPRFTRLYDEMLPGEPLPLLTEAIRGAPLRLYAVVMVAGVSLLLWMHRAVKSPSSCRKINITVGIGSILLFILYVIGLFLPLTKMIDRIGG